MIDFDGMEVRRFIMHEIVAKQPSQDTATARHSSVLLQRNIEVETLIKTRLIDAAGRDSKAFELEFGADIPNSCFGFCEAMKNASDDSFRQASADLADILASTQRRVNIPGGYFLILQCQEAPTGLQTFIFIKAEPHEALQQAPGQSSISLIKSVFLSPSQRLYKVGIVFEKQNPGTDTPNDLYGCFLFDDQFRKVSYPAEYFYKDFLGFAVGNNSKIQSQRFFIKTEAFIVDRVDDVAEKARLFTALRSEFTVSQEATINPDLFAQRYLLDPNLLAAYQQDVMQELPTSFVKDDTLVKMRLSKRKMDFPREIKISGPATVFDERVKILSGSDLNDVSLSDPNFTYLRVAGKPYSNE